MKTGLKICKCIWDKDYYNKKETMGYIMKKRGWFGWKTFIEVYDGNWTSHFTWSYFQQPPRHGYEVFKLKKDAISFLKTYYRKTKITVVCKG
jgi:hypothetical protein